MDEKTTGSMILAAGCITEIIMRVSHADRKRFGLLVSVVCGIAASLLWAVAYDSTTIPQAIIRGIFVGFAASGGYSAIKTGMVHVERLNGKGGDGSGE